MTNRDKFEVWVKENTKLFLDRTSYAMTDDEDQQYIDHDTNLVFLGWQAAIASQQSDGNDLMKYLDKASLLVADWPQWKQEGSDVTKFTNSTADDGWIEWGGGECPVGDKVSVNVRFRCDDVDNTGSLASEWRWSHYNVPYDIIAYRIVG